jgi:hypothetical protein
VVLDGLFSEASEGTVRFHEATHLQTDDAHALQRTVQRRVLGLFRRRGLLDRHTVADMLTWQAAGGFSLDASVRVPASDRAGRERLLRYCARPPFALERLRCEPGPAIPRPSRSAPGAGVRQVLYHLPRPALDGRTVLALSPLDFLAALARLIPPPRVHRHRYHGVLAPNARLRARVVALGRTEAEDDEPPDRSPALTPQTPRNVDARSRWARLLARIHEVFPLQCPDCGAPMRILAFLTEPGPVQAILRHLGLPATPPPLSPARGPPQADLGFDREPDLDLDQTPAFDPGQPEPVPDFDNADPDGGA